MAAAPGRNAFRAAPFDLEQVQDLRRPRLGGQQLREGDAGIERVRRRTLGKPGPDALPQAVEPLLREVVVAGRLNDLRAPARARAVPAVRVPAARGRSPARGRASARSPRIAALEGLEAVSFEAPRRCRIEDDAAGDRRAPSAGSPGRRVQQRRALDRRSCA